MNLTARIKNNKCKPNYILNVNINIPIRPSHLTSDRPVSGQFTFSPSQLKKKLKLEIPSARTTYQCESRKISYLGDTLNTISHRNNNRKGLVKSALPTMLNSQVGNGSKKSKSMYRSQATSPIRKKMPQKSTNTKMALSNKNIKNKQLLNQLINQSQDNILGYTNQSTQLSKIGKSHEKNAEANNQRTNKNILKISNFKSQSPMLEEPNLIQEIRQFQKSAQFKKQHLNYVYLKEKVLVLASIKKIQRAWRNYKTRKLIKSYSNNISLKFTGKIKNQLLSGQDEQIKILTVRSCGFNGKTNQLKRQGKKNLSNLLVNDNNYLQTQKQWLINDEINNQKSKKKKDKRQYSAKSAIVKFQMEQINKWEELIKQIREGKKVQEVLQKSFKRKEQLQKQLSNNLKQISLQQNQFSSNQIVKQENQKKEQENKNGQLQKINLSKNRLKYIHQNNVMIQSNSQQNINLTAEQLNSFHEASLQTENQFQIKNEDEQGLTTQRRKKKLQFFQNQIRKIDNEESQSNQSYNSYLEMVEISPDTQTRKTARDIEEEQNIKLKRKLQAINKVQLFNDLKDDYKNNQVKKPEKEYKNNEKDNKIKQIEEIKECLQGLENTQIIPLSINKNFKKLPELQDRFLDDRLDTFRNRSQLQKNKFEQQEEDQLFNEIAQMKLNSKQKQELSLKIQEQLLYDLLLDLSQKQGFIAKMQVLYAMQKQSQKIADESKPEGICTNLESIKDYLQNFVAFAFQQQPVKLVNSFNSPEGPSLKTLLKYLNKNQTRQCTDFHIPVLPIELFNLHWFYASEQIYFDVKYADDPNKQQERVKYLKQITKTYFRAIFDGFNECLEPYRLYGQTCKPFPWNSSIRKNATAMTLNEIKPLVRLGYKKLSQVAILYCGLLFEDKKHNMSIKMMEQIQSQRLSTLIQMQQQDGQLKWATTLIEETEIRWKLSQIIQQILIIQICWELSMLNQQK